MKKLRNLLILLMLVFLVLYFYQPVIGLKNLFSGTNKLNYTDITREREKNLIFREGKTLRERVLPPKGFTRIEAEKGTFGDYLQNLPLKPHGAPVLYYNGQEKIKNVHCAVIDMEIGDGDLQ